jgi:hypothetical protein
MWKVLIQRGLLFLVAIMMSDHVVPSAVAQSVTVKYVTKANLKHTEILMELRVKLSVATLSSTQVHD